MSQKHRALPTWIDLPYRTIARFAEGIARLSDFIPEDISKKQNKLIRTFEGRSHLLNRYNEWSSEKKDPGRPLVWFHASSVGEGLMALPIIEALREANPRIQIAYTYFSPSAEKFASRLPVDFFDFLPFDSRRSMSHAIKCLKPDLIVFSKLDVWPTLAIEARKAGVKTALTSAALPDSSSRLKGISRRISQAIYPLLDLIGAASSGDAENFLSLGVSDKNVIVTGDTRYDQAWKRANVALRNRDFVEAVCANSHLFTTLVAGSTWPGDEAVILDGWLNAKRTDSKQRLIIAPHEVKESHIAPIAKWARYNALKIGRYTQGSYEQLATCDVILIDAIGVLADIYTAADIAYVGGGFHSQGLHSLVEPGVFFKPTLIGPRITGSRDAALMLKEGGVKIVEMAQDVTRALLSDNSAMCANMKRTVESELGATERSAQLLNRLLDGSAA